MKLILFVFFLIKIIRNHKYAKYVFEILYQEYIMTLIIEESILDSAKINK